MKKKKTDDHKKMLKGILTILVLNFGSITMLFSQPNLWTNSVVATGSPTLVKDVALDTDENVYAVGRYRGELNFECIEGEETFIALEHNLFISKSDSAGNCIWAKTIEATRNLDPDDIKVDHSGNLYITGSFRGEVDFDPGPGEFNVTSTEEESWNSFLLKLNEDGDFLWVNLGLSPTRSTGNEAVIDEANNVYWNLYFEDTLYLNYTSGVDTIVDAGLRDAGLVKFDPDGNKIWLNSISSYGRNRVACLAIDDLNNYIYMGGSFGGTFDFSFGDGSMEHTATGDFDYFICQLDLDGNTNWVKTDEGSDASSSRSIGLDNEGNVYFSVAYRETIDFDFEDSTAVLSSNGGVDMIFAKLDITGKAIWANAIGGPADDYPEGIAIHNSDIYFVGDFEASVDFDPEDGLFELVSAGYVESFVANYDSDGIFDNAFKIGSVYNDYLYSITFNSENEFYLAGGFSGTVDFDPTEEINYLTADNGGLGGFYSKYRTPKIDIIDDASVTEQAKLQTLEIYPNPFHNSGTLILPDNMENMQITIYNLQGEKTAFFEHIEEKELQLEKELIGTGTFFVVLSENGNFISAKKFMIL